MSRSNLGPILLLCAVVVGYLLLSYPNVFAYVLVGIIALAAICVVAVILYAAWWWLRNCLAPTARVRATVVRKRSIPWDISIPRETPAMTAARLGTMGRHPHAAAKALLRASATSDAPDMEIAGGDDFYVTYLIGSRELELLVSESAYIEAEEGASGLLSFRGEQFISFTPSSTAHSESGD